MDTKISELQKITEKYKENYGFSTDLPPKIDLGEGLSEEIIEKISKYKKEDVFILQKRLEAYNIFLNKKLQNWGPNLNEINFSNIHYYISNNTTTESNWNKVPSEIKETFKRLKIPEKEQKFLAGVATQYESNIIYKKLEEKYNKLGIIFLDIESAYKQYPEIFKKYFSKLIPAEDNKFTALNTAVFSGGTFIYIPKNVKLKEPLQTYFRINSKNIGQFERTLIIAEDNSELNYIEGCTAPMYDENSLHAGVVEVFVGKNAKVTYTTIQNWSKNVLNLTTKRALVQENGFMKWVDCNLGSSITMKYPNSILNGDNAKSEILSVALASKGQILDTGGKIIHNANNTRGIINSKSICLQGGNCIYRGTVKVNSNSHNSETKVNCDSLLLDEISQTSTYPTNIVNNKESLIEHEATVSNINKNQLLYLQSRGLSTSQAMSLIVLGFIDSIINEFPPEYFVELNALIDMSMEGAVG